MTKLNSPLPARLRRPHSPFCDLSAAEYIETLESEIARLNAIIDQMTRKQRHGCTDATCQECDR